MDPYATVQTIERNTYDLQEDLYVRVVGPYNLRIPFTLEVTVQGGICGAVQPVSNLLPVISGPSLVSGSHQIPDPDRFQSSARYLNRDQQMRWQVSKRWPDGPM